MFRPLIFIKELPHDGGLPEDVATVPRFVWILKITFQIKSWAKVNISRSEAQNSFNLSAAGLHRRTDTAGHPIKHILGDRNYELINMSSTFLTW